MKKMNLYEIETLEELIAYSNDSLNIDDEASVTIKVELFAQLKEDIFYGKCKEPDLIAPALNLFFLNETDKLEKRTLTYYVPSCIKEESLEKKYKPFELMNDMDFVQRWLPRFFWAEIEKKAKAINWLNKQVECIDMRGI